MIHGKLHKTRFSEIGFTMNSPSDWRFVDLSESKTDKNLMHVIGGSYPTREQLLQNVEQYAAEYGCEGANKPNLQTPSDALLNQIARDCLGIKTLYTRNSDALDFYSLAVWNVKRALQDAWIAGATAAWKAQQ